MKPTISILLVLLINLGCAQSTSKPITEFSQNDIINGILVDVRTPEEYNAGHIDNSLNINWFDSDFAKQMQSIGKDETIYVYCRKGSRSAKAAAVLDSLGYKNVVDLEGGYNAWKLRE